MDEDKLQNDVRRGHEANALLDNALLKDAMGYLKQSYTDAWMAAIDPAVREQNWHYIKGLEKFRTHLEMVARDGRLADAEVAQLVRKQKQTRKYG